MVYAFIGHTSCVTCMILTKDNNFIISGSEDMTVRIWNIIEKRLEVILTGQNSPITCLDLSINNMYLACGSINGSVICRNLQGEREEFTLSNHFEAITCVKISNDHRFAFTGSNDKSINIWNLKENKSIGILLEHTKTVTCLSITNDNKILASGSSDTNIIIWDVPSKRMLNILHGHNSIITCIVISQDAKYLLSASVDNNLKIWNLEEENSFDVLGDTRWIKFIEITHDNKYFITASEDGKIKIWEFAQATEKIEFQHSKEITCLILSNNSQYIISGSCDNIIKIFNFEHLEYNFSIMSLSEQRINNKKSEILLTHKDSITCIAITSDSHTLISGSKDQTVKVWSIKEQKEIITFTGHSGSINCVAISEAKDYIVSGSEDSTVKLWNLHEKRIEATFKGFSSTIFNATITNDHKIMITCKNDNKVYIKSFRMKKINSYLNADHDLSTFSYLVTLHNDRSPVLSESQVLFSSLKMNLCHFYSYTGQDNHLKAALDQGCDIRTDSLGRSPLYYSIEKNTHTCKEVLLQHIINLSKNHKKDHKLLGYVYALRNDLEKILKSSSNLTPGFLESLFPIITNETIPQYIVPKMKLPIFIKSKYQGLCINDFIIKEDSKKHIRTLVAFRSTLIPLEISIGSKDSHDLFNAMLACPNQKIFRTRLIRKLVRHKWNSIRPLVILFTVLLWTNIFFMILLITYYGDSLALNCLYMLINLVLFLFEVFQVISFGIEDYLLNFENILDIVRLGTCIVWVILNAIGEMHYYIEWWWFFVILLKELQDFVHLIIQDFT